MVKGPERMCLDNLKTGVMKADLYEPELNPKLCSFAADDATVVMPPRPYKSEHKGKIENGIGLRHLVNESPTMARDNGVTL